MSRVPLAEPSLLSPAVTADARRLRWVAAVIVAVAVVGVLVPAGPGWDFANFYDTGSRAATGHLDDIYHPERPIGGRQPQGQMAYWSPPLSAFFYVPLAVLPPLAALVAFKVLGTLAWMTALWLLAQEHLRHTGTAPGARGRYLLLMAAGLLIFQPIWAIYRVGGQTTPFVLLLFTLALRAHVRGRVWAMAAASVIACLVKPAFALVPAWLLVPSSWRVPVALATAGAVVGLVGLVVVGLPLHLEFLDVLRRGAQGSFGWPFNSSLYVVAESVKAARPAWSAPLDAGVLALKLLVVGLVGHAMWRARALDVPRRPVGIATCCWPSPARCWCRRSCGNTTCNCCCRCGPTCWPCAGNSRGAPAGCSGRRSSPACCRTSWS